MGTTPIYHDNHGNMRCMRHNSLMTSAGCPICNLDVQQLNFLYQEVQAITPKETEMFQLADEFQRAAVALTGSLRAAVLLIKEIRRYSPSAVPTHIEIDGAEIRTSVLMEMIEHDLSKYAQDKL